MSSLRYGNEQGDGLRQKQSFVLYRFAQPVMRTRLPRARKPASERRVIDSLPEGLVAFDLQLYQRSGHLVFCRPSFPLSESKMLASLPLWQ